MEKGLLWLPLLFVFIWLAWAGKQEYQKVQTYQIWAKDFERHKYDIYAILGQQGDRLTWGIPTAKSPVNLKTISFSEIHTMQLKLDRNLYTEIPETRPAEPKKISILLNSDPDLNIPFTDLAIACSWFRYVSDRLRKA
jgi:hypothetical protein